MAPDRELDGALTDYFAAGLADGSYVCWAAEAEGALVATGGVCLYTLPPTYRNPTGRTAYIVWDVYPGAIPPQRAGDPAAGQGARRGAVAGLHGRTAARVGAGQNAVRIAGLYRV